MADPVEQLHVLGLVALAMALGGLVGLERQTAHKPAGLRTHMLVAGAAALLVSLGGLLTHTLRASPESASVGIQLDPSRIIVAVVMGVSFLGAGTIIRSGDRRIEGLTTAASLLVAAAVGIAVSSRQYIVAFGVTLLVVAVLRLVHRLEMRLKGSG